VCLHRARARRRRGRALRQVQRRALRRAAGAADGRRRPFVGHGTQDDVLPVTDGRAIRDLFQPLVRDFAYHEYPISHATSPAEIRDVAAWLTGRLN
jgi:phospholipase/carboxylesterase